MFKIVKAKLREALEICEKEGYDKERSIAFLVTFARVSLEAAEVYYENNKPGEKSPGN